LKTQFNKYFVYLGENQTTCHVFVQVPYVDMEADKDEDLFKTVYYPQVIVDNVASMSSRWLKIISYIFVFVQTAITQIVIRDLMSFSDVLSCFMYCCVICCQKLVMLNFC